MIQKILTISPLPGSKEEQEDDEEITLQTGKAKDDKRKKVVVKTKSTSKDQDVIIEEMSARQGDRCANVEEAMEFRKYIRDVKG